MPKYFSNYKNDRRRFYFIHFFLEKHAAVGWMVNISLWFEWIVFATTSPCLATVGVSVTNIDLKYLQVKLSIMNQTLFLIILTRSCCIWFFEKKQTKIIETVFNNRSKHERLVTETPKYGINHLAMTFLGQIISGS